MKISFTFRHMESTEALKTYAQGKLLKLQKYFHEALAAEVTFSTERHLHAVDVQLEAGPMTYRGHEASSDMYASIDAVMDKVRAQLASAKGELRAQRRRSTAPEEPTSIG